MADAIEIKLVATGVSQLVGTFRTIEQTVIGLERGIVAATERSARARVSATEKAEKDRAKLLERGAKDAEKVERTTVTAAEKAEKDKTSALERAERARLAIRERSATMAGAFAKRQADAEIAEARRAHDAREKYAGMIGGAAAQGARNGLHLVANTGRAIVQGALQVGGGFGLADSVTREVRLTGTSATLAASSQADPDGKKWKTQEILARSRGIGNAYSMDPEEVLKGIGQFKDLTGNLGRGVALAPQMAKIATALGADTGELMANAGNISMSSPNMSNDDIVKLVRVQAMQGIQGGVELKDMAKYGLRLTAGASLYGGDRATNIATMGAFAQIARQHGGAASAAEATLASQRFSTDVAKHHKSIEAAGIRVSDGKGGLRAADEIVKDMLTKSGGDVLKFDQFKLGERGNRVLTGFADIYKQAGGGKSGLAAVTGELGKFTKGVSDEDIEKAAKERLGEADKQVTKAMNELRDAAGKELLPEFLKLVPVLRDLTPMIGNMLREATKFAEWFAANPIKGIGAIVLASIAKELAMAGIGEAVKSTLTRMIAGASGGAVPGVGGGKPGGVAEGVSKAAVLAAITYAAVKPGVDDVLGGQTEGQRKVGELLSMAKNPKQRAAAQAEFDKLEAEFGGGKGVIKKLSAFDPIGQVGSIYSTVSGEKNPFSQTKEATAAGEVLSNKELIEALKANSDATRKNTEAAKGGSGAPHGSPGSADAPTRTLPLSARP